MNMEELFSDSEESGAEMKDADWVPVKAIKGAKKSMMGVRSSLLLSVRESFACIPKYLVCVQRNSEIVASLLLLWKALIW